MSERQVSIEGKTYPLPAPFLVIATQNPVEFHGTCPLPEAQLDRFAMNINLGYPTRAQEVEVLYGQFHHHPLDDVTAAADSAAGEHPSWMKVQSDSHRKVSQTA